MNIDLDKYFDDSPSTLVIFGKTYVVDDDAKTVLKMQKAITSSGDNLDEETLTKFFEFALGTSAAKEIMEHKMKMKFLKKIMNAIVAVSTDTPIETIEAKAEGQFRNR